MSSPGLVRDVPFGHSSKRRGQFAAMDPATGALRWATEGRDGRSAAIVAAGEYLLFLTTEARLVVARAERAAYPEMRRYTVGEGEISRIPRCCGIGSSSATGCGSPNGGGRMRCRNPGTAPADAAEEAPIRQAARVMLT
jgi:hypothetical protein